MQVAAVLAGYLQVNGLGNFINYETVLKHIPLRPKTDSARLHEKQRPTAKVAATEAGYYKAEIARKC